MRSFASPPPPPPHRPSPRRPRSMIYSTSEDDTNTEDDLTNDGWDDLVDPSAGGSTPGRDPTRPSFDTSSLTAPPAPINHLPVLPTQRNQLVMLNSPHRSFPGVEQDENNNENEIVNDQNRIYPSTSITDASSSSHHRRHRWSDVIDPGVPPPHPQRSQRPLILPPPPPLLHRRWSETSSSSSPTSSSSSSSSSSTLASSKIEGYSLDGGDSSSVLLVDPSRIIAIGIPDPLPTTTTLEVLPPDNAIDVQNASLLLTMNNSHHSKTFSASPSSSSHHRRHCGEAALLHQADIQDDDALGRMPWRRHNSSSQRMAYHPSDIEDSGGCTLMEEDDEDDEDIDDDDEDKLDDDLFESHHHHIHYHSAGTVESADERLARHLAARELQEQQQSLSPTTTNTNIIPLTTPVKSKINMNMNTMQVTSMDTPNQKWWKWSPGPRSIWTKSTSRLRSSSTVTTNNTNSNSTVTTQRASNPHHDPKQNQHQQQQQQQYDHHREQLQQRPPSELDAVSPYVAGATGQDSIIIRPTTEHTDSHVTMYPPILSMLMADDMMVDLDSYPAGIMTKDTNNNSTTSHTNDGARHHHPTSGVPNKTTGLRRIDDYDVTNKNLEQSRANPLPHATTTTVLRATSSGSSSSSSPWSFTRWQQKLHASIILPPERFKQQQQTDQNTTVHRDGSSAMTLGGPQLAGAVANTTPSTLTMTPNTNHTSAYSKPSPTPPHTVSEKGPRLATPFAMAKACPPAIYFSKHHSQQNMKATNEVFVTDTDSKMAAAVPSGKGPQMAAAVVGERRPSLFSPIVVRRGQRNNNNNNSQNHLTSSSHHRRLQLAATVSMEHDEDDDDDRYDEDEEDEVEAQAGIPILLPGAFAVDGIDSLTRRRSRNDPQNDGEPVDDIDELEEDNLLDDVSEERRLARQRSEQEEAAAATAAALVEPPLVTEAPIQAELHPDDDQDLVLAHTAVIVQAVNEEQEQAIESKEKQRLRLMRRVVIVLGLVALITIIIVVVVIRSTDKSSTASIVTNTGPIGWSLVGSTYNLVGPGDEDNENFGWSFATNYNATRIIVGIPGWDQGIPTNPLQLGQVQIFQQQRVPHGNVTWSLEGTPWYGATADERLGRGVAMSADGSKVAVASEFQISIYSLGLNATVTNPTWNLVAEFFPNSTALGVASTRLSSFGAQLTNMAMSADGSFLVVGIPNAGDNNEGVVRTYAQIGFATWSQIGQDIVGNATGAMLGTAVDISIGHGGGSGTSVPRIAVGAPGFDQSVGQVETFVLQSNMWSLEQYFTGSQSNSNSGASAIGQAVAFSEDGLHLAIGASGASTSAGISMGQVQVYQLLTSSGSPATWVPLGNALSGSSILEQFGYSVALSSSGSVLAVGAPQAQDPSSGNQVGRIRVFQVNTGGGAGSNILSSASAASSATWSQVGGDIVGINSGEDFGYTVALSANGMRVLGGAPFAPYDGGVRSSAGAIRVYDSTL